MSAKRSTDATKSRRSSKLARKNRRSNRRRLSAALEPLENRLLLAFSADVFSDINLFGVSANVDSMVEFDGRAFFSADDGQTGSELWSSDGTAGNTSLFADLLPGLEGSKPSELTVIGTELFFRAEDDAGEFDLWKTDGTVTGTTMVYDANAAGVYQPEQFTSSGGKLFFTAYQIDDSNPSNNTGTELWVHDPVTSGTTLVRDINPSDDVYAGPMELTDHNGTLFFSSYGSDLITNPTGYDNRELWMSDGTFAGTVLVADIAGALVDDGNGGMVQDDSYSSDPTELTSVGTNLFFNANDVETGTELYRYDGTNVTLIEINPGPGWSDPKDITSFGGRAYFGANDGTGETLLLRTNAAGTGIEQVGSNSNFAIGPTELTVVGSNLFYSAAGVTVSDSSPGLNANNTIHEPTGTPDGLAGIVESITAPNAGNLTVVPAENPNNFTANAITSADDGPGWVSNGAIGDPGVGLETLAVGDLYLEDIDSADIASYQWEWTVSARPGESLSNIEFHGFASGNQFDGNGGSSGGEDEGLLFELILNVGATTQAQVRGDDLDNWFAGRDAANVNLAHPGGAGVTTATVRMSFINLQLNGSEEAVVVNAGLTATSGQGRELYRTNGTINVLVEDIAPGGNSNPSELTAVGNRLYFSADEPTTTGRELWTAPQFANAGNTLRIADTFTGTDTDTGAPNDGSPEQLVPINGQLFFTSIDNSGDRELWTSSGTAGTTAPLLNPALPGIEPGGINPATQSANIEQVVVFGTDIYFVANDGENGEAVFVADTTSPGSVTMIDMTPGTSAESISGLSIQDGSIWFYNNLGESGNGAIYRTNGTVGGTSLVGAVTPIVHTNDPNDLFTTYLGRVYFTAIGAGGAEVWRSNDAGTSVAQFVNIYTGNDSGNNNRPNNSNPASYTVFNSKLYFAATEISPDIRFDGFGRELWETDGTVGGTQMVADIRVDDRAGNGTVRSSNPDQLTVSGSHLFLTANGNTGVSDDLPEISADNSIHVPSGSGTPDGLAGLVSSVTAPNAGTLQTSSSNNAFTAQAIDGADDGPGWVSNGDIGDGGVELDSLEAGDLYIEDVSGTDLTTFEWEWTVNATPGQSLTNIQFRGFASGNEFDGMGGAEEDEGLRFTLTLNTGTTVTTEVRGDALDNWNGAREISNVNLLNNGGGGVTSATVRMEFIGDAPDAGNEALVVNGSLKALSGVYGRELYSLDTSGNLELMETSPGNNGIDNGGGGSFPEQLTDINGTLYFSADAQNDEDDEPYTSDGNTATLIQTLNPPGGQGSHPEGFVEHGGDVYFSATGQGTGRELWKATSLTSAELVNDVAGSANPTELAATSNRLFYAANDENSSDRELWTSSGPLTSGSAQALDLFPGPFKGSNPTDIVEVGGKVYFVGEDELHGRELFVLSEFTPSVESVVINDGSAQRSQITSVTVTFDAVVDANTAAFELTNIDTSTAVEKVEVAITEENFKTVAVLTFGSGASVVDRLGFGELGNSLADGNYRLDVVAAQVADSTGGPGLAADYVFGGQTSAQTPNDDFYRHYGDSDGDGDTDFIDFSDAFLVSFGSGVGSSSFRADMDANGDGDVDFIDFQTNFLPAFGTGRA